MKRRHLSAAAAVVCVAGGAALTPPTPSAMREVATWFVRPATLPFAWQGLLEARRTGDAGEVFARAQQILHLLPTWTDGHAAFAYDYALDDERVASTEGARIDAAEQRLRIAIAWLEQARATAGRREAELLQYLAMLPEVAVRCTPGLEERLLAQGGIAGVRDHYLATAERLFPGPAVREQRTFFAPTLAASMLAVGNFEPAIAVLDNAIERSTEVRDQQLATEWRSRLVEVVRNLRGEAVDLRAVRDDPRMAPLLPHLR